MVKRKMENGSKAKEILVVDDRPSFCSIVFAKQSNEHLPIPSEFLKDISNELSDRVTLKVRSGRSWTAKVSKRSNGVYIEDGWQEFLKDNSLGKDEFLRFWYDGNMCFSIQIFGKNGCERINVDSPKVPHIRTHQNSASTAVKRPRGRPRKHPIPTLNHHLSKSCEDGSGKSPQGCQSNGPKEFKAGKSKRIKIEEDDEHGVRNLSKDHIAKEWKAAESFRSKFPHFSSSVGGRYQIYIPTSFSKEHIHFNETVEVVLRNQKGESWAVTLIPNRGRHCLSGGWAHFMDDNKLELGDLCIFELVGRKEMKVHGFRI